MRNSDGEYSLPAHVWVAGIHAGGAGYPNARGTTEVLRDVLGMDVRECGRWLPEDFRFWRAGGGSIIARLKVLASLMAGNASSLVRVLSRNWREPAVVYVPYPSVFLLWLLSWVPRALRPVTVADAFISLWGSMVQDRGSVGRDSLMSRLLFSFERRALGVADRVIVDTLASERYLVETFGLQGARVCSMPLATDPELERAITDTRPNSQASVPTDRPLRVLFVGTFIPLHGLGQLLESLSPILADRRFQFVLVGDGQESARVSALLDAVPSSQVEWVREWQTPMQLAAQVRAADVCLGVFGGAGKAARVLPFKVYLYLALGRPVLTQSKYSLPRGVPQPPLVAIDLDVKGSVVDSLMLLKDQPELRARLSAEGATFYQEHLSRHTLAKRWRSLLAELSGRMPTVSRT